MAQYDLKLLDCTLRDGGYINGWKWGFKRACEIVRELVKAKVDMVEVGFLRNVSTYNPDITVCSRIEELNYILPENYGNTMFSAMAMRSNYDISKLKPYGGHGIEMIRITAHDYDIESGLKFAYQVKEKGYKLSINPINIMGYSDEQILWILKQVNIIQPYQFSIVDPFGSMKRRDLDRIVSLVDNNLDENIRVALHLHENMSLSCALAQEFVDKHLKRPVALDGSLMGMGRIPGNLPVELIADYLNDYTDANYDIDYLMDAIQDYISPLKGDAEWGYTPAYFLPARFNLHRNYAEHYLKKGDLTIRDINHILSHIERSKATVFDRKYADNLYERYQMHQIDDNDSRERLKKQLKKRSLLVIAPGATINLYRDLIQSTIEEKVSVVIAVNFVPQDYKTDYVFFSNNKRFLKIEEFPCKVIATSNLPEKNVDYYIDYNSLTDVLNQGCNSLIMLLKLLSQMEVTKVLLAGADGYKKDEVNYYSSNFRSYTNHDAHFNQEVSETIHNLDINVDFLTPSEYDK